MDTDRFGQRIGSNIEYDLSRNQKRLVEAFLAQNSGDYNKSFE
jgi:hypothetical protein